MVVWTENVWRVDPNARRAQTRRIVSVVAIAISSSWTDNVSTRVRRATSRIRPRSASRVTTHARHAMVNKNIHENVLETHI